jgi:hypothetical protein
MRNALLLRYPFDEYVSYRRGNGNKTEWVPGTQERETIKLIDLPFEKIAPAGCRREY